MEESYNKALEDNPNKPNRFIDLVDMNSVSGVHESIRKARRLRDDMLLNRFANEFYQHLRPSKHMTTNDIAQFIIDFLDNKETD